MSRVVEMGVRFAAAAEERRASRADVDAKFAAFVRELLATGIPRDLLCVWVTLPPPPPETTGMWFWKRTTPAPVSPATHPKNEKLRLLFDPHQGREYQHPPEKSIIFAVNGAGCLYSCSCTEHHTLSEACDLFPDLSYEHVTGLILGEVEARVRALEADAEAWAGRRVSAEIEEATITRTRKLASA